MIVLWYKRPTFMAFMAFNLRAAIKSGTCSPHSYHRGKSRSEANVQFRQSQVTNSEGMTESFDNRKAKISKSERPKKS